MYKKKRSAIASVLLFPYELVKMTILLVFSISMVTLLFTVMSIYLFCKTICTLTETAISEFINAKH
jgi:hypothetical protein